MLHLEEDPALERLVRCALRYANATEQDRGFQDSHERDVAKNCLLNAARQYAAIDEGVTFFSGKARHRLVTETRARLEAAAVELELAAREDGTSTDERHSAAECAIWDAGIAYAKAKLDAEGFVRSISFDPALFAERHRDCLCGASVPEIADTCQRCGGLVLGAPLLPGSAEHASTAKLREIMGLAPRKAPRVCVHCLSAEGSPLSYVACFVRRDRGDGGEAHFFFPGSAFLPASSRRGG